MSEKTLEQAWREWRKNSSIYKGHYEPLREYLKELARAGIPQQYLFLPEPDNRPDRCDIVMVRNIGAALRELPKWEVMKEVGQHLYFPGRIEVFFRLGLSRRRRRRPRSGSLPGGTWTT